MNGLGAQQQSSFPSSSSSTSHFFTTPSQPQQGPNSTSHYSSSQSLSSGSYRSAPPKPKHNTGSVYPPLTANPKSSSPSWSTKSAHLAASSNPNSRFGGASTSAQNGGHLNGGINLSSTTAYLLSGKTNNNSSTTSGSNLAGGGAFSKSVTNLSSSASFPSFDLLGSIEQPTVDPVATSWDDPPPSYTNSAGRYTPSQGTSNNSNNTSSSSQFNRHSAYGNFGSSSSSSCNEICFPLLSEDSSFSVARCCC